MNRRLTLRLSQSRHFHMIRRLSSSAKGGKVFTSLQTTEKIRQLINTPTWNIYKDLIESNKESKGQQVEISKNLIDRLLKMSGLQQNNELEISNKLKEQVLFINKLHKVEVVEEASKVKDEELTLSDLMSTIKQNQKQDTEKGELGDWKPTKLSEISKNDFYIVREGLIKK